MIVPRTCVEVSKESQKANLKLAAVPLESFRSESAYVLLGDPGSGKSTAFEVEAEAAGDNGVLLSARDFITFDADRHPEWRGKTIFIDGLDEVRVGTGAKRDALDRIRKHLDDLDRPRFRISCREADWLGNNDLKSLAMVSPEHSVAVLRLNPLTDENVGQILDAHPIVDDPRGFIAEARWRGVDRLLENPLNLDMLARAVRGGDAWPRGRLETFAMACQQMATDFNEEHQTAGPLPSADGLMKGAGQWYAEYLVAGAAGWSIDYNEQDPNYIGPGQWDDGDAEMARRSLATRLFKSIGGGRFIPAHRHVAEFLGAWHIAHLVNDGLPIGRVLAMITAADGNVVTNFRGLSAWLAAHCPVARASLIESDPVGVALYGDLQVFAVDDKRRLLPALDREVVNYGIEVSAFTPLTTPDMEKVLQEFLSDGRRDDVRQYFIRFLLRVLTQGAASAGLSTTLWEIIYDDTRWPDVSKSALQAFINNAANRQEREERLRSMLVDIVDRQISDPDRNLLEVLLPLLDPQEIPPLEIWGHFAAKGVPDAIVEHLVLWEDTLLQRSTDLEVAEFLDRLNELMPDLRAPFRANYVYVAPVRLLGRALHTLGDKQKPARLYDWLSAAAHITKNDSRLAHRSAEEVRIWLEQRPAVQKAVLLEGLSRCPDDDDFERYASQVPARLHHSDPPSDFRSWCLDTAVEWADRHGGVADYLLRYAVYLGESGSTEQWITREYLMECTRGHPALERRLAELLKTQVPRVPPPRLGAAETARVENDSQRRQLVDNVSTNLALLRENQAAPELLHEIGMAYFGCAPFASARVVSEPGLTGLLPSVELLEAAVAALRGTVRRRDVPEVVEIIRRSQDERPHPLGLPFLAGIDEIFQADRDQLEKLDLLQMQQAVAFHYFVRTDPDAEPEWLLRWLESRPEMIADVLVQCATAISSGTLQVPGLYERVHQKHYAAVAAYACLPLLKEYPTQQEPERLETLNQLLWSALRHSDRAALQILIAEKLSCPDIPVAQRIHWLSAGVMLAPETYRGSLESTVVGADDRIGEMASFFSPEEALALPMGGLDVITLRTIIRLMGSVFEDEPWADPEDPEWLAYVLVETLIDELSARTGEDASRALDELVDDDALVKWRVYLEKARDRQRIIRRDASYRHPSFWEARQTLSNLGPSNPRDLAALLTDKLTELATRIRTTNTDDWLQYWNEDYQGHPLKPKREEHCRDAFLSDLRGLLPGGVVAEPEGEYANDGRADIRVVFQDFNVPIEVKKDRNRQLWSSLNDQLIARYASEPATGGHGIYLVFWFGGEDMPAPPQGQRPAGPVELRERLEAQLHPADKHRISVCVVDVSPLK